MQLTNILEMGIKYTPEMLSVVIALLLCPVIPFCHVILNHITKSIMIVKHTLMASFLYVILWFISILYVKQFHLLNNYEISGLILSGASTIGLIVFGYIELIGHPFRGFSLELLINIYLI